MDIHNIIFAIATFLHDLFTVIWMGGMIVTAISFLPAAREALGPGLQMKAVMAAFLKRQSLWVYISMAGLIATGLLLSKHSPSFTSLFTFGDPYGTILSLKHILVIVMIAISLYRAISLRRPQAEPSAKVARLGMQLLLVNAVLAVLVLLLSGSLAALAVV